MGCVKFSVFHELVRNTFSLLTKSLWQIRINSIFIFVFFRNFDDCYQELRAI